MIEHVKKMTGKISAIEEALKNIVRVGEVVGRDAKKMRVRVQFQDSDGLISYWYQILTPRAHTDKFYWLPDLQEMVICLCLPFGREQGFVLGSAYNGKDLSPDAGEALVVENDDAISISTSTLEGAITIVATGASITMHAKGMISISSETEIDLKAPKINLN